MSVQVRKAVPADTPVIHMLVRALAEYEKLTPPDDAARNRLINDIFGPRPRLECYLAEVDGRPVAYAFIFESY
jgi:hypothetical protein